MRPMPCTSRRWRSWLSASSVMARDDPAGPVGASLLASLGLRPGREGERLGVGRAGDVAGRRPEPERERAPEADEEPVRLAGDDDRRRLDHGGDVEQRLRDGDAEAAKKDERGPL